MTLMRILILLALFLSSCTAPLPGTYVTVESENVVCDQLVISHVPHPSLGLMYIGFNYVESGERLFLYPSPTIPVSASCTDPIREAWSISLVEVIDSDSD